MKVVDYNPKHYSEIAKWWKSRDGWEALPKALLPITGFVVENAGKLLCAGFLYMDQSTPVCMLEWVVANPDNCPRTSIEALKMLLDAFAEYADSDGKVLFTTLRQPKLAALYEKYGFEKGDEGMTNMVRSPQWGQ